MHSSTQLVLCHDMTALSSHKVLQIELGSTVRVFEAVCVVSLKHVNKLHLTFQVVSLLRKARLCMKLNEAAQSFTN